jgi:hypothetical protein
MGTTWLRALCVCNMCPTSPPTLITVCPPHPRACRAAAPKHTVSSTAATSSRCSRCGILVTYGCVAARLCYRVCFKCKREMLPPGEFLYYLPELKPRQRIYVVSGACLRLSLLPPPLQLHVCRCACVRRRVPAAARRVAPRPRTPSPPPPACAWAAVYGHLTIPSLRVDVALVLQRRVDGASGSRLCVGTNEDLFELFGADPCPGTSKALFLTVEIAGREFPHQFAEVHGLLSEPLRILADEWSGALDVSSSAQNIRVLVATIGELGSPASALDVTKLVQRRADDGGGKVLIYDRTENLG